MWHLDIFYDTQAKKLKTDNKAWRMYSLKTFGYKSQPAF